MPEPVRICQRLERALALGQAFRALAAERQAAVHAADVVEAAREPEVWSATGLVLGFWSLLLGLGLVVLGAIGWRAAVNREQRHGRLDHPKD